MKFEQKRLSAKIFDFVGGRTRTRTWDPLIKSQLLYQLSYAPEMPAAVGPQGLRPVAKRVPTVQGRPAMDRFAMASARPRGKGGAGCPLRGNERTSVRRR